MAQRSRQSPPAGSSRKRQHRDETDDERDGEEESDKPSKTTKTDKKEKEKKGLRSSLHAGEKKKWRKRREPLDVNLIVAQEEIDKPDAPCWATLHAGPSALLPRRLCCCCGFAAKYRCSLCVNGRRVGAFASTAQDAARTGQSGMSRYQLQARYVCSARCLDVHQAHDCAPKHLLHWM
ncbi:conserved hypothetical protein [Neospora caninum Liverpool]|uniref:HIT-type domain-containing protein n=1 Tax=Neospora caninum (strain Liverpool) TaxID=572307 RepID=F0VRQ5_NEOCL|nr:conserved hypothetical protein [Neospora caninum Liverpool]CBZ56403.1 conserved hypothetical protein [Neospora caninum Liverpool]CEL71163.1 TPA: hypothetical protein BN1204_068270 [Neospora caninum Liverpool]|eukprot:XP_003886428.1 conserved hypothetical protein [Neospora caninum Liverpool]